MQMTLQAYTCKLFRRLDRYEPITLARRLALSVTLIHTLEIIRHNVLTQDT